MAFYRWKILGRLAEESNVLERMTFIEGRITELSQYKDGEFDLVLCLDAPISYTYPRQYEVIRELVRIEKKAVVLGVSSRLGSLPYILDPVQKMKYLINENSNDPLVKWYRRASEIDPESWEPDMSVWQRQISSGLTEDPDDVYSLMENGGTPWPVAYSFMPEELRSVLKEAGLYDVVLSGPGALARTLPAFVLKKMLGREEWRNRFLDACFEFDRQPSVCGMGKDNLVAVGRKKYE
jgi:hypothetical protein